MAPETTPLMRPKTSGCARSMKALPLMSSNLQFSDILLEIGNLLNLLGLNVVLLEHCAHVLLPYFGAQETEALRAQLQELCLAPLCPLHSLRDSL